MPRILVIDDEEHMRWLLRKTMEKAGFEVETAAGGREGLELFRQKEANLVLLDLRLPDLDGLMVLRELKAMQAGPVIILTAYGTIETAIEAMKQGAAHYLTKPFDLDELKLQVDRALHYQELEIRVSSLEDQLSQRAASVEFIGQSAVSEKIREQVRQVAPSAATVLLTGESGTGKEVVARMLHSLSGRKKPLIDVNCAALPDNLLESELFGHEKGAFTGASQRQIGKFELADGGSLFLDEIAEMSVAMQAKLLRVLQEKTFYRLGGAAKISVDVRVIAATNQDPAEAVKDGRLRQDLYYRLSVVPIHLPPLREHREDISLLAEYFLRRFDLKGKIKGFSAPALAELENYSWPGNVRELENTIERAVMLCRSGEVNKEHLWLPRQPSTTPAGRFSLPAAGISLEELEKDLIRQALELAGNNQTRAAQLLGLTRPTLLYRLQKYGFRTD